MLNKVSDGVYETICLIVDCWFHCARGFKDHGIDYCNLALYERSLVAENIGVKQVPKDDGRMSHTKKLFGKEGDLTRFTYHNAMYHLILDHAKWGSLYFAQCKTLEKSNKDAKLSLKTGKVGTNNCNRIMRHKVRHFVMQWLVEGNGVNDQGVLDPFDGKNKINDQILRNLKDLKPFSLFADFRNNPQDPEYLQSFEVQVRIRDHHHLQCKFVDHEALSIEEIMQLLATATNTELDQSRLKWYKEANIWRKHKKILIGIGNLVINKSTQMQLLLVTGIISCKISSGTYVSLVIGHKVNLDKHYHSKDKNIRATIGQQIECWPIDDVDTKVIYSHLCDDLCEINAEQDGINHNWNAQPRIVVFWWTGLGRVGIGDPLGDKSVYDRTKFRYC